MTTPTKEQIRAAERRAAESRERMRAAAYDFRATTRVKTEQFKARLAQPSTLAWALGFGILIGRTLLKRKPASPPMPRRRANDARGNGMAAGLAAILSRVGWRFMSGALMRAVSKGERTRRTPTPPARPVPPVTVSPVIHTATRSTGETVH